MIDIVIEVCRGNLAQIIHDATDFETTLHFPAHGTITMRQDCSKYHIKQGDKINIRVKGRFMDTPAVIKDISGHKIYFEQTGGDSKWIK